jgi:hypothetical protein
MESALYADRDTGELRRLLSELERRATVSATRALISDAYRFSLGVDPNTVIPIPGND